jgi:hypothetical protein
VAGLVLPSALRWQPRLTVVAASLMAFVAYGRDVLAPI